ncbi:MAG: cytochrome c-type biogenesis protein [Kiloniellales bacterium]
MRPRLPTLALALAVVALAAPVLAVEPDEMLDDPVLEARARALSKDIRCLVCQNQSIDDSNASLAKDLRILVRERLVAGDSNQAVLDYLTNRYGDFVLLNPRVSSRTYALWYGPAVVLALGVAAVTLLTLRRRRRRAAAEATPLSEPERRRLEALIEDSDGPPARPTRLRRSAAAPRREPLRRGEGPTG